MPSTSVARSKRRARLVAALGLILLALALYLGTFVVSYGDLLRRHDPLVRADVARLEPARVEKVDDARDIEQLRAVLRDARARGLKVSISGSRHSQGGHTYRPGGVVLNMRTFNRIRAIDTAGPRITVESGATWTRCSAPSRPGGSRSRSCSRPTSSPQAVPSAPTPTAATWT